jgi:hypothetical protein
MNHALQFGRVYRRAATHALAVVSTGMHLCLDNSGKEVLTTEQHELAQAMGRAVRADPIAMKYLSLR